MAASWAKHQADGFDHQLAADVGKGHTSGTVANQIATANTRFAYGNAVDGPDFLDALGQYTTWRIAGAQYLTSLAVARVLCVFRDASTNQVYIQVNADGSIQAFTSVATSLGTSAPGVISAASWFWISTQILVNNSTGLVHVYVNGVLVLNLNNIDTQASANTYCTQGGMATPNVALRLDDYVISAGTGTPVAGDALVDSRVLTSFVDQQGTHLDFTGVGTGSTHVDRVRDATPGVLANGDTNYLQSNAAGDQESFLTDDLPIDVDVIHFMQITAMTRKDDASARTCRLFTRRSGTDTFAAAQSVLDTYRFLHFVQTVDPSTAVAWVRTGVDATEIGYELTT